MMDRYSRLPPEEQKIVLAMGLGAAVSLWLAVAWEEPMLLIAVPLLTLICFVLMRTARRRAERQNEDWLF